MGDSEVFSPFRGRQEISARVSGCLNALGDLGSRKRQEWVIFNGDLVHFGFLTVLKRPI